ncbi:actin-like ATPase domain-containing [Fusarium acutatum]|uniref:Actin-like ATPase domain-containing n=1 Tax=Fusarium acutatum TaxID=78861 RepID=A0A8H4NAI5_9HYPO|nr:actin-like ATPase domain-containing [Fusarium acutatum]
MGGTLRSQLIVGIDFGTTYSGVCWATTEGQKKLQLITDWPNPSTPIANAEKVPSTISYKDGRVNNWGFGVDVDEEHLRWFKLLLEPESTYSQAVKEVHQSNKLLGTMDKTAEQVVSDYLREIWNYTKEHIRKHLIVQDWEKSFAVRVVLTVPAIWSLTAKDKTLKAAALAGLPTNIQLVSEPEAAALATFKEKAEDGVLQVGDAFVVCDAGGGTVDLISYKINKLRPLDIEECAIGDGGLCGSVFLDAAFEKSIKAIVGLDQYNRLKDRHKKKMLQTFDYAIKRAFAPNSSADYSVDLPGVEDNEAKGILDERIALKHTALRTIFDYTCGQIETLVQNQVTEVKNKNLNVKAILLVGGFGSSRFLHHRLEQSYSSERIAVVQIDGAWPAICRGACLWGLEYANQPSPYSTQATEIKPTMTGHILRASYGVEVSVENAYIANNQMRWLWRQGELCKIGDQRDIIVTFAVHGVGWLSHSGTREFVQSLYYCKNECPSRKEESVRELCQVKFSVPESLIWMEKSFRSPVAPGKWRRPAFNLIVKAGSTMLEYIVKHQEKEVASVEAEYIEY